MQPVYDVLASPPQDAAILLEFQEQEQYTSVASSSPGFLNGNNINNGVTPDSADKGPTYSVFSIAYYKEFFNINSEDVLKRLKCALKPTLSNIKYYEDNIRPKPDLYGPVWICITLAFCVAMASNLLDYFTYEGQDVRLWKYEFHIITKASVIILVYVWIIPILLWSIGKWYLPNQMNVTALELICVYGYGLTIYIPLSLLLMIHIPYLQWVLLLLAAGFSGIVLMSIILSMFDSKNITILSGVIILHVFFNLVLYLSFYQVK